ncbi:MAG: phosphopantetheine-binding protein [Myxococcota bacterium]
MNEELERRLKEVIVESLMLEDVTPGEIDSEEALFVDGLGLDSIDALELAIAVDKTFGVRIKEDEDDTRTIFKSVRALAAFIAERRAG